MMSQNWPGGNFHSPPYYQQQFPGYSTEFRFHSPGYNRISYGPPSVHWRPHGPHPHAGPPVPAGHPFTSGMNWHYPHVAQHGQPNFFGPYVETRPCGAWMSDPHYGPPPQQQLWRNGNHVEGCPYASGQSSVVIVEVTGDDDSTKATFGSEGKGDADSSASIRIQEDGNREQRGGATAGGQKPDDIDQSGQLARKMNQLTLQEKKDLFSRDTPLKNVFVIDCKTVKYLEKPVDGAVSYDGLVIACDMKTREVVHFHVNRPSDWKRLIKPGGFIKPSSAAFIGRTEKRFAVKDGAGVHFFETDTSRYMFSSPTKPNLFGLAAIRGDGLVSVDVEKRALLFFSSKDGHIICETPLDSVIISRTTRGPSKIRFLCFAQGTKPEDDMLAMVDNGLDCVFLVGLDGKLRGSFGSTGSGDGQFDDPAGILWLPSKEFLVADSRNHRLLVFSPEGAFKKELKMETGPRRLAGIQFLPALASDEESLPILLVFSLWPGKVSVYAWV